MCFVLHLGCERRRGSGPVHSCSLHWEACTPSDIWTAQEAIIPALPSDFFFFKLLSLFPYHSIYFRLCKSQSGPFLRLPRSRIKKKKKAPLPSKSRGGRMMNSSAAEPADSSSAAGPSPTSPHPHYRFLLFFHPSLSHSLSSVPFLSFHPSPTGGVGGRSECTGGAGTGWWHITAVSRSLISLSVL